MVGFVSPFARFSANSSAACVAKGDHQSASVAISRH